MLHSLHVKNLALIDEADVTFQKGLNILTGETGAGKSLLLGSLNLALGAKASKDFIRYDKDFALVELVFFVDEKNARSLRDLDVFVEEDGQVVISRRLTDGRSISKVNGETVSLTDLRKITAVLLDIHGQHEHQSLLYPANHLKILDEFAKDKVQPCMEKLAVAWKAFRLASKHLEEFHLDEEHRLRDMSFIQFEIDEILQADLKEDEEELLSGWFKKAVNSKRIMETLSRVHEDLGNDSLDGIGQKVGRAVRDLSVIADFDDEICSIRDQAEQIDGLLVDLLRDLSSYMVSLEFDEQEFFDTQARLDLIHNLEHKYGRDVSAIKEYLLDKQEKLSALEQYEVRKVQAVKDFEVCEAELRLCCEVLSGVRVKAAKVLQKKIVDALKDLNFLDVRFDISIVPGNAVSQSGFDVVEFLISTNPGEEVRSLAKVASGGELSRIMLAIKTILSDKDGVGTLLFDEIDTGISGRTAQRVSEKLKEISRNCQVICITHLPQIAAMADEHFLIDKQVVGNHTVTSVRVLDEVECVSELARLLGGTEITETVLRNAKEMRELAGRMK